LSEMEVVKCRRISTMRMDVVFADLLCLCRNQTRIWKSRFQVYDRNHSQGCIWFWRKFRVSYRKLWGCRGIGHISRNSENRISIIIVDQESQNPIRVLKFEKSQIEQESSLMIRSGMAYHAIIKQVFSFEMMTLPPFCLAILSRSTRLAFVSLICERAGSQMVLNHFWFPTLCILFPILSQWR
jgi:hypothetical protein